ncbi:MAG: nucleotidyl transferase AbiEii/AbiGii toxin family protein [Propionibacteriaceae bacterium]|jgi:hypothetical protein|nr:nucleotidyl transferase AbiEii/AbiGii toxin family protein [Propionibacteriaceae bacterium]
MATSEEARRLNQRINSVARNRGLAANRLRHHIAFQRVLARLALDDKWVLKGGFSLEMRLGLGARATKDLDMLRMARPTSNPLDVQDLLQHALDADLGDGFTFQVNMPRQMDIRDAEPSTWRVHLKTVYSGSLFTETVIDVVLADMTSGADTEALTIAPELVGQPFTITAIDLDRHAAEKYHACVRVYANERTSTRVKDLVDLVLLVEGSWLHVDRLGSALIRVFQERNGCEPPAKLSDEPPGGWVDSYPAVAAETGAENRDALEAWALISRYYERALE